MSVAFAIGLAGRRVLVTEPAVGARQRVVRGRRATPERGATLTHLRRRSVLGVVVGGAPEDVVVGGAPEDVVVGGAPEDVVVGGAPEDRPVEAENSR